MSIFKVLLLSFIVFMSACSDDKPSNESSISDSYYKELREKSKNSELTNDEKRAVRKKAQEDLTESRYTPSSGKTW